MNTHLSEDQFASCFLGNATAAEQEHLDRCAKCKAEFEGFNNMISSFRSDIRTRVDARTNRGKLGVVHLAPRPTRIGFFGARWAFIAASAAVFAIVPFLAHEEKTAPPIQQPATAPDPDVLMNAVYRHLSRTLPAPMEPMMDLLPSEETKTQSGGVQ